MVKRKTKVSLNLPVFQLQNDLLDIADKIFIIDLQSRMVAQKDVNNQQYNSLSKATRKIRNRKGTGFDVLRDSKQLFRSFKSSLFKKNSVRIQPSGSRTEGRIGNKRLGDILQNEGVRSKSFGRRKFLFFSVSNEAERDALKFMEIKIDKAIKDGGRRIIRRT